MTVAGHYRFISWERCQDLHRPQRLVRFLQTLADSSEFCRLPMRAGGALGPWIVQCLCSNHETGSQPQAQRNCNVHERAQIAVPFTGLFRRDTRCRRLSCMSKSSVLYYGGGKKKELAYISISHAPSASCSQAESGVEESSKKLASSWYRTTLEETNLAQDAGRKTIRDHRKMKRAFFVSDHHNFCQGSPRLLPGTTATFTCDIIAMIATYLSLDCPVGMIMVVTALVQVCCNRCCTRSV